MRGRNSRMKSGPTPVSAPASLQELSDLVVAVGRDRDRTAFTRLFTHFAPRLKTYFLRAGLPGAQAEDLAQDALVLVWKKAVLFDPARADASRWVFAIARNLRTDVIRRERNPTASELGSGTPPAEPEPEGRLAAAEAETRLRHALRTLPEAQMQVLLLSYFADEPHSAICRELRIPLGTVKARLRRALIRLRALLEDEP